MKGRFYSLIALMGVMALLAAACGTDTADPGPPETVVVVETSIVTETETVTSIVTETVEVEAVNPLEGTTVTVFGPESSDVEAGAMRAALDLFAAQSGINIEYTGQRSFSDDINAQAAGGNPPDIAVFPQPGKIADFAREGYILEVDSAVQDVMNANFGRGMDLVRECRWHPIRSPGQGRPEISGVVPPGELRSGWVLGSGDVG